MIRRLRQQTINCAIVALGVAGCAASVPEPQQPQLAEDQRDYFLEISSLDDEQRFALTFSSRSNQSLCIAVDDWPNGLGQVSGGRNRATLTTAGGHMIAAKDTNFGYCVGDKCTLKVAPHQEMSGSVAYRDFGDPDEIAALREKRLIYHLQPFVCPRAGN